MSTGCTRIMRNGWRNSRLRREALAKAGRSEIPVYIPSLALSTDNAAMIAAAGLRMLERGTPPQDFHAAADLPINSQLQIPNS